MSVLTYKCPNCDAGLSFDPNNDNFACEYCLSKFTEEQLNEYEQKAKEKAAGTVANKEETVSKDKRDGFANETAHYECPSCGASVMTDKTTAATFCYYCHNPVVLSGKLSKDMKPHKVIPFAVGKDEIQRLFEQWCSKKKFIEDGFVSSSQMDLMTGVYFPFWVVDSNVDASIKASGNRVNMWQVGDIEYTETSFYEIRRSADIFLNDVTIKALDKPEAELLNGIYPYSPTGVKDFSMAYLSGFQAETYNVDKTRADKEFRQIINDSANKLLREDISGYTGIMVHDSTIKPMDSTWLYTLMPAWLLTYKYKGESYYFALNGQTGKIAGRVPVSPKKLTILFAVVTIIVFIIITIGRVALL